MSTTERPGWAESTAWQVGHAVTTVRAPSSASLAASLPAASLETTGMERGTAPPPPQQGPDSRALCRSRAPPGTSLRRISLGGS